MNQHQSTRRNFIRTTAAAASSVAAPSFLPRFAWGETAASGWDLGPFVKRKEPVLQPTPESVFTCPIRGTDVRWAIEWQGAGQLGAGGVTADALRPGDPVIVTGNPGRDPAEHRIRMVTIERTTDGFGWGTNAGEVVD